MGKVTEIRKGESWRRGYTTGRKEAKAEALKIIEEEIVIAHTTKAGKTSRLTSAYNKISKL